jgi:tyrosine-protein kinase Etk/Wzc
MDSLNNLEHSQPMSFEQPSAGFSVARYLRYWYLFAIGLLLAIAGAFLYLRYSIPMYSISSMILVKDKRDNSQQPKNEQFDYENNESSAKNLDNEIIMLKSVSLMQRVLAELTLNTSYYVKGKVRTQEVYQGTLPFKLIISQLDSTAFGKSITISLKDNNSFTLEEGEQAATTHNFGQLIRRPYGQFTVVSTPSPSANKTNKPFIIKFQDLRKVAIDYTKKLSVTVVNKQASILSLTLTDEVPEKGKEIINKLVEVYNKEAVEDKNAIASNTISFIDERLKYLSTELTGVEKGVESFRQKYDVADVRSQISQSLADVSEYNKQAADYGIQLAALESISEYISNKAYQDQLVPSTLTVQSVTLSGLITKFNELQLERERQLRTNQSSNPIVESLSEQLTNLRTNILANIASTKNNVLAAQRSLQAKSGQSGSKIQRVPTIERGLEEIKRQQELKRSLYLYLLQKREEAALSLAANVSSARIIDPAIAGDNPVSPQKPAVVVLALMLGLGLPFAFVYITGMMDDKVQSLKEVSWATGTPILGELVHNKTKENVVIGKGNRSAIAEMFRLIRTNFQFATDGRPNKVILVTSSMSGEGKSFFSLNLGASLVLAGKSVVVVNLDLRKRDLISDGASGGIGISNYLLSENISVNDVVYPSTEVPGLFRINAGALPANPAEVLMSPKLAKILDVLKQSFDHIILDSSPVGQVSDAFALAPYIDYTIYVVRYNFTRKAQLEIINKIQADKKMLPIALVLNDAKKNNLHDYGYGNGYGDGYGYEEEKAKKNLA